MRKPVIISCVIISICSLCCRSKRLPEGILPQSTMRAVMWDLVRAGEFLDAYVLYKDTSSDKASRGIEWYREVYKLHHITEEQFKKSYAYYKLHPELMKEVLDSLAKMKLFERKAADTSVTKKDSLPGKRDSSFRKKDSLLHSVHVVKDSVLQKDTIPKRTPGLLPRDKRRLIDSIRMRRQLRKTPQPA